jgi:tripartite-type tricarboxylate transporter receptor subunit TctC
VRIKAAVPPPGGAYYIAGRRLEVKIGARFILVPYGGASPSIVATAGGHTDVTFSSPSEVITQVRAGNLRVLAVLGEKRSPLLPKVPTLLEKGIDLTAGSWRGIVAPQGTPADRIELLSKAFQKAIESDFIKSFSKESGMISDYLGPEDFRVFMEEEEEKYREVLTETD